MAGRQVETAAAHHLMRPEQVRERRKTAPHMHQPAKRKQQENRHAQHEVNLVWPCQRNQSFGSADAKRKHPLCPVGQDQHHAAIGVSQRERQRDQAERELHPQNDQDGQIGTMAGEANTRVEHAAVNQESQADEADEPRHAAGDDGKQLLVRRRDEMLVNPVRREQPDKMAKEQEQNPDVEQVAAPAQRARPQHLRRVALPRVLVAVEPGQAAHQEYHHADIRIGAEEKAMEIGLERTHVPAPVWVGLRTRWIGCGWPGRACPLVEQPSNTGGSTQHSSSAGSAASLTDVAFSPASSSRAPSTLAYRLSRCCSALNRAFRMWAISPRNARASRGGWLETNSSTAGR